MAEVYDSILKGLIGRVRAVTKADNYFPVVGDSIRIDAETAWGQSSEWQTQDGSGNALSAAGNLTKQKDSKSILVAGAGELQQKFIARNKLFSTEVLKTIYAMPAQVLPYFSVTAVEIVRIGEAGSLVVKMEHGYTGAHTIVARLYKENETINPVKMLTFDVGRPTADGDVDRYTFSEASERGIYDVEVDVTDTASEITFTQRHNKLITVTPALCPKPADTSAGYEVVSTYKSQTSYQADNRGTTFELRLWRNVEGSGLHYAEAVIPRGEIENGKYDPILIADLPAGTTLCLKLDSKETERYPPRLFLRGSVSSDVSAENGTPNFTYEEPLVITHDRADIWDWNWRSYGAVQLQYNCRNLVLDGRGYHDTGIHFHPFDDSLFVDSCFFLTGGTSDFEMFCCDIDGAGFAGVSAKTDPIAEQPWYWRENGWEFRNLKIHHSIVRNTVGEGIYCGYYGVGNVGSESNPYHAHIMRDIRVYRCDFINNGFDSVQVNNACGIEFCYNVLSGCGYRRESNQGAAFSCCMDGKIYNCIVKDNYNVIAVMSPFMGKLEVFNCILTAARMDAGFVLTSWTTNIDNGATEDDVHEFDIHNNIIKAANIANIAGDITYSKYTMNDNIFITEKGDTELPGYLKGDGNIFLQADMDYENIDKVLKVADSANYNYQPAHNSRSVTEGKSSLSPFDFRGYKNWYVNVHHAGPFMGVYKDASVVDSPIILTNLEIVPNSGLGVSVRMVYKGMPAKYRVGEIADLSEIAWQEYSDAITYTFASEGDKTLYGQLQDGDSNVTEIKSASVTVSETHRKAVISLGWGEGHSNAEFDTALKINRIKYGGVTTAVNWKWQDGTEGGTIKNNNNVGGDISNSSNAQTPGAITGDDSGVYPDEVLRTSVQMQASYPSVFTYCEALVSLPPGTYTIRLYNSITGVRTDTTKYVRYLIVVDDVEKDFDMPVGYNILNNLTDWLEQDVTIRGNSFLLRWGVPPIGGTFKCPLNIVEIEEV